MKILGSSELHHKIDLIWGQAEYHNRSEENESMDVDEDLSRKTTQEGDDLSQYNLDEYDDEVKTAGKDCRSTNVLSLSDTYVMRRRWPIQQY
jgi:hypothetical protein